MDWAFPCHGLGVYYNASGTYLDASTFLTTCLVLLGTFFGNAHVVGTDTCYLVTVPGSGAAGRDWAFSSDSCCRELGVFTDASGTAGWDQTFLSDIGCGPFHGLDVLGIFVVARTGSS